MLVHSKGSDYISVFAYSENGICALVSLNSTSNVSSGDGSFEYPYVIE